jgi:hypothetical protein
MSDVNNDKGVAAVLVERFESQRLPRALEMKSRVDKGATLTDADVAFLEDVMRDTRSIKALVERQPEWAALVSQVVDLYHQITTQALQNEKAKHGPLA